MDSNKIEALLQKYWEAETSQEEEQQLREWFRNHQAPEPWKETAAMFRYFDDTKKKSLDDASFNATVVSNLPTAEAGRIRKLVYNTLRIAAGVSVLCLATWFVHTEMQESADPEVVDTYSDPKLAFEETKKALLLISQSFGKAEKQARKINMFNEAQEEIKKEKPSQEQKL
ncbi:hypothetical protein [Parachryseolinea silvisoli]|uniref:hypothetical protein n=1 Tax=Parachryseolinea silvisoli TaxID=2873601 RepID=UPI002265B873|nr:hypothetical protein [Parachryseolinea silvisoli]MCD9019376.1 hypothetical protein [Parachryseolinea silvisoli]